MADNSTLNSAAKNKNDEFYTQYYDIQRELNCYLDYDENVFKDKTILLPCDDPDWSNFTRFFVANFKRYKMKKLISTSYAVNSKKVNFQQVLSIFETESPQFDATITDSRGKIFTMTEYDSEKFYLDNLHWKYLEGDGDFRSEEVKKLFAEADVIITNPPFSLFREFLKQIIDFDKKFLVIANKNCITYKEVFPLIKDNKIWSGAMPMGQDLLFQIPKQIEEDFLENFQEGSKYKVVDGKIFGRSSAVWLTNLEHGRRHKPLMLMTYARNLRYSKHKIIREQGYPKYDNYDAIEVPFTDAIPDDYEGVMGVPITFLDKYCPEQFEILGDSRYHDGKDVADDINYINGKLTYRRILIRHRK